jgi:hypothetical protein
MEICYPKSGFPNKVKFIIWVGLPKVEKFWYGNKLRHD